MKRLISLGLGAVILATALAVGSPKDADAQGPGLVSSVLNKLELNHANLKSLRSAISMRKYDSQLRESEDYYGVVLYVPAGNRNAMVRVDWNKPQHEILTVINGRYTIFRERLRVAYTGPTNSGKSPTGNVTSLMNMSRDELNRRFQPFKDVREETLWGGVSTTHLTLVPKSANEGFKYAEVWIDSSGMPVQFKTVERNDDSTTVRLNNLEKNLKLSLDQFVLKLPPDVKIIKS